VELWLAPLGAYRLLGLPMDALSGQVVELTDVLGADSRRLITRFTQQVDLPPKTAARLV
jgi:hypothetical protein